jgi:DNA-directed RNA polymerase subunit RPC12/RpoP
MKTYTVEDVIKAGYNLEPIKCKYCGSLEVTFLQYVGDAQCAGCGEWQLDKAKGETEEVKLIASAYEWICPGCETMYTEIEITEHVECKKCQRTFTVSDYFHAHK